MYKWRSFLLLVMLVLIVVNPVSLNLLSVANAQNSDATYVNPTEAEKTPVYEASVTNDYSKIGEARPNESWRYGFEDQGLTTEEPTEGNPSSSLTSRDKWNFNKTNEWLDFIYGYGDSVEVVIGIDNTQPTSYAELESLITRNGGLIVNTVSVCQETKAVVAAIPRGVLSYFVTEVKASDLSRYVEPNMKFQATSIPNDPYWPTQWGPKKIEADYAWNTTTGDPSVLVAVIDTGIDWNHPDLVANYVALGYDWVNNDPDPMDDYGHGTHCAGIIAAELNNSIGIAGVAQIQIMAEKGLDAGGWGTEDDLANAIIHAVDQGADILSNSWGGYGESVLIHEAVEYAYDNGVLVIASAGNEAWDAKHYPAAYDEVVAVTATDEYDYPAYFTNFGDWVELAAPGVDIYSTVWDDSYTYMSGTSMAAPHVAGVAALTYSAFPNVTRDWLRLWLRQTADDLGDPGFDAYYGYGRVNARRAVEEIPPEDELLITNWKTPPYVEPNSTGMVNTTVLNFGASDESNITVQLLVNSSLVDSTLISFLAAGTSVTVSCSWSPTLEGSHNVTSYVVPKPGEAVTENNIIWAVIYAGFPLKVFVLDSAGTDLAEVSSTWQVLNSNWHAFGDTMVYIDYATLNIDGITYNDLVATDADVLIISCAYDWEFTDSEIDAISRYVLEGHGLIATAGTFYNLVPNNNKLAPLLGLNETTTWDATGTDLLHIENTTHPLLVNIPDPFVFREVGTAIPSDHRWDSNELFGGTYVARGHYLESAIVVNRGLVYISPWLEVIPSYYHFHLQLLYNAITWTRYQKPEHELIVSLESPISIKPGESVLLNATVSNGGLNNETNVELRLLIDGSVVNSTIIPQSANGTSYTINYLWAPTVEKTYNVTAYAPPVPNEDNTLNNIRSKMVIVSTLLVALFKNWDPWDYPANEEALSLFGIPYVVFSSSDFGLVDLSVFPKVVIASDQDWAFYEAMEAYRWWFEDYASDGGILEIHAACWGWHGGGWLGTLPGGLHYVDYPSDYVSIVDTTHPVVTTPNPITDAELDFWSFSVHGHFSNYPTDSRIVLIEDFTSYPAYLEFNCGAGVIVASSQTLEWAYSHHYSLILENSLLYLPIKYEHELAVTLEAPTFLGLDESSLLNATVYNRGLSNETGVELQLLINGTMVNNVTVPELQTGSSQTINYLWTPTVETMYNVTAYAPPVPGENITMNNVVSVNVTVSHVIADVAVLNAVEIPSYWTGGWNNDYQTLVDALIANGFHSQAVTNEEIIAGILNHFDVFVMIDNVPNDAAVPYVYEFWLNGGGITAFDSSICFLCYAGILPPESVGSNGYGVYWDYDTGSTAKVSTEHPVTEGYAVGQLISGQSGDAEYIVSALAGTIAYPYYTKLVEDVSISDHAYVSAYEPTSGGRTVHIWDQYHWSNTDLQQMVLNAVKWTSRLKYEHELFVSLDAPVFLELGDSSLLNATVYNRGLSNETGVELQLLINGTVVSNVTVPVLPTGASHTMNHFWTPLVEATYNVTAYAPPVPGENVTINNVSSKMVSVGYFVVALISDHSELLVITDVLDSMGIGYDIYNNNGMYLYTGDLDLLLHYSAVVFYTDYRYITANEYSALEAYLSSGGNLLVTGFDCLLGDYLLADLIRSQSYGDNVGEPDLYVVDATHPIMNGPHGSFPSGYHIYGLYSDCDAAEADAARMATTVAELADGYDKIVATDGLPGKVVFWNGRGDYDWTWNMDCEAMFKNALAWFVPQYEHELTVALDAPVVLELGDSSLLNATVYNRGLSNETGVELQLLINGTVVSNVTVPVLPTGASHTMNHFWTPLVEATYNVTAYAPPVAGEIIAANNWESTLSTVFSLGKVCVDPSEIMGITVGDTFTIDINVTDVTRVNSYEIRLDYNTTILDCTEAFLGDFITGSVFPFTTIDDANGRVVFGILNLDPFASMSGSGLLATLNFTVTGEGSSLLDIGRWDSGTGEPHNWLLEPMTADKIMHYSFSGYLESVLALSVVATVDFVPNTLNLKSEGTWVTCYIELPEDCNVSDIDIYSIMLNDTFPVSLLPNPPEPVPTETGDYDDDAVPDLMVKFNRTELTAHIYHVLSAKYGDVTLEITGQLTDGTVFEGSYVIWVAFAGDVNNDGFINIFDLLEVRDALGTTEGDFDYNPDADVNLDTYVNIQDLLIVRDNLGATIPPQP